MFKSLLIVTVAALAASHANPHQAGNSIKSLMMQAKSLEKLSSEEIAALIEKGAEQRAARAAKAAKAAKADTIFDASLIEKGAEIREARAAKAAKAAKADTIFEMSMLFDGKDLCIGKDYTDEFDLAGEVEETEEPTKAEAKAAKLAKTFDTSYAHVEELADEGAKGFPIGTERSVIRFQMCIPADNIFRLDYPTGTQTDVELTKKHRAYVLKSKKATHKQNNGKGADEAHGKYAMTAAFHKLATDAEKEAISFFSTRTNWMLKTLKASLGVPDEFLYCEQDICRGEEEREAGQQHTAYVAFGSCTEDIVISCKESGDFEKIAKDEKCQDEKCQECVDSLAKRFPTTGIQDVTDEYITALKWIVAHPEEREKAKYSPAAEKVIENDSLGVCSEKEIDADNLEIMKTALTSKTSATVTVEGKGECFYVYHDCPTWSAKFIIGGGVNPQFFNTQNRYSTGLYVGDSPLTARSEVAYHLGHWLSEQGVGNCPQV